jgi:hypothetical protein
MGCAACIVSAARLQVTVEYEIDVNNADKHKGELKLCSGTALVTAARSN